MRSHMGSPKYGTSTEDFTIGVEEEYHIINPATRELHSRAKHILAIAEKTPREEVQPEA